MDQKVANHFPTCTFNSSVGRAEDCSAVSLISLGRWFNSGSKDDFRKADG